MLQLVLDTHGLTVKKRNKCFYVIGKKSRRMISPQKLSSILITTEVNMSTAAILLAAQHGIAVIYVDRNGKVRARLWSPHFVGTAQLRLAQMAYSQEVGATRWMKQLILYKLQSQLEHIEKIQAKVEDQTACRAVVKSIGETLVRIDQLAEVSPEQVRPNLLGLEGAASQAYWRIVGQSVPVFWQFRLRSRRPATDCTNAALNYCYGMLYQLVEEKCLAVGLDPQIGMLHQIQYGKPVLAFDGVEVFRHWVDEWVLELCRSGRLQASDFDQKETAVYVGKGGKRILIPQFRQWLQRPRIWRSISRSVNNHIYQWMLELAQAIRNTSSL